MNITWKYVKQLNDKNAVKDFLSKSGVNLPERIVRLLEQYNGGRPSEKEIITSDHKEHVFKSLLSYNTNDMETIYTVYPQFADRREIYPIGTDPAGNYICYDIAKEKFVFLDHETDHTVEIIKMPF